MPLGTSGVAGGIVVPASAVARSGWASCGIVPRITGRTGSEYCAGDHADDDVASPPETNRRYNFPRDGIRRQSRPRTTYCNHKSHKGLTEAVGSSLSTDRRDDPVCFLAITSVICRRPPARRGGREGRLRKSFSAFPSPRSG